jgi:hypothetical protein
MCVNFESVLLAQVCEWPYVKLFSIIYLIFSGYLREQRWQRQLVML